jgi:hypothetical protein
MYKKKKKNQTFTTVDPLEKGSLLVGSGSAMMSFSTQWSLQTTERERERERERDIQERGTKMAA